MIQRERKKRAKIVSKLSVLKSEEEMNRQTRVFRRQNKNSPDESAPRRPPLNSINFILNHFLNYLHYNSINSLLNYLQLIKSINSSP